MKAKRVLAIILSLVLIFSVVPSFGVFAADETVVTEGEVTQNPDEEFVPEYDGDNWVKTDNYIVNLSRAFANLASSIMYSFLGTFWTALFPMISIPIVAVGSSTVAVAFSKFCKALAGYKV